MVACPLRLVHPALATTLVTGRMPAEHFLCEGLMNIFEQAQPSVSRAAQADALPHTDDICTLRLQNGRRHSLLRNCYHRDRVGLSRDCWKRPGTRNCKERTHCGTPIPSVCVELSSLAAFARPC